MRLPRRKLRRGLASVVGIFALISSGCSAPAPGERRAEGAGPAIGEAVASALVARNDTLLAAVRRGDAEAAATLYTEDGLLLPPDGSVVRGRAAIRSFWEAGAGFDSVSTAVIAIDIGDAIASHTGRYALWSTDRDGVTSAADGIFLIVWRKESDGEWRVQADMWN